MFDIEVEAMKSALNEFESGTILFHLLMTYPSTMDEYNVCRYQFMLLERVSEVVSTSVAIQLDFECNTLSTFADSSAVSFHSACSFL